jgi:D-alanine-D-alanine ligase
VAKSVIIEKNNPINHDAIKKPFVIKPISDGSSVGVEVILENDNFEFKNYHWKFGDKIMVEEYISGKELEVAIIDNEAIGVLEVRPKKLFYDYECKYTAGMTDYIMPAEISQEKYDEAMQIAKKIHLHFGCLGISRAEFILSKNDNKIYFLEINTHPGFTATSLIPKIAAYKGISFEDIVQYLINTAKCAA